MGSMIVQARAVADYLAETRKLKVGVLDITLFRPFPGDLLGKMLQGKKGVAILERTDQPLAEDLPLMREVAGRHLQVHRERPGQRGQLPYPGYAIYTNIKDVPPLYSGAYGLGSRDLQPEGLVGTVENMLPDGPKRRFFYLGIDFTREAATPKQEIHVQKLNEAYPKLGS